MFSDVVTWVLEDLAVRGVDSRVLCFRYCPSFPNVVGDLRTNNVAESDINRFWSNDLDAAVQIRFGCWFGRRLDWRFGCGKDRWTSRGSGQVYVVGWLRGIKGWVERLVH